MTKPESKQEQEQESEPSPAPAEICEDLRCPVQCFEDDEVDEPVISHVFVTKSKEIFYANHSIELEEQLPNGEIGILVVIDVINFPEDGDRSIITIAKDHIDYSQEYYCREKWLQLMKAAFCTKCEAAMNSHGSHSGLYQ